LLPFNFSPKSIIKAVRKMIKEKFKKEVGIAEYLASLLNFKAKIFT
jgi:hypothetical protein